MTAPAIEAVREIDHKGAAGFAKPGMPADGEILVAGDQWPTWKPHK